jgi:NADH:ubiquinone reductase (H+-translocating)
MTEHKTRVVVIGGGYAGVIAANHLRLRPDVDIMLVNPRPEFVERIRLHQLVAGSDDAVVDYAEILGPGIELVVDAATHIDIGARHVELFNGPPLPYDYLIYAVGSGSGSATVAGADQFGYPIADLEEAKRLTAALDELH